MNAHVTDGLDSHLAWASSHFAFAQAAPYHDLPWSRLVTLRSDQATAWLKLPATDRSATVSRLAAIAEAFPDIMPPVLAAAPERGAILFADHGGHSLAGQLDYQQTEAALTTYGAVQARAADDDALLSAMPRFETAGLVDRLLDFLGAVDRTRDGLAAARRFIGAPAAAACLGPLRLCARPLQAFFDEAQEAPRTLCHCDLHAGNLALGRDGRIIIMDWDDAQAGPAGLSLHALLGGCTRPVSMLASGDPAALSPDDPVAALLRAYLAALTGGDGERMAMLLRPLGTAIAAGAVNHILSFGRTAPFHDTTTEAAAATIRHGLGDLLDLCTLLVADDDALAAAMAALLAGSGGLSRALPLVRGIARRTPRPARALAAAATAAQDADRAEAALGTAVDIIARENAAEDPHAIPSLGFTEAERNDPEFFGAKMELGFGLLDRFGALMIEDAFDTSMIDACRAHFLNRYDRYFVERTHDDALTVGDKRYMITADIEGPFNQAAIYGAPTVLPLVHRLLGEDAILGSLSVVTSLPGAKEQWIHRDHPALFPEAPGLNMPEFAINLMVPLVPLDDVVGTTCIVKGSHRTPGEVTDAMPRQVPFVPVGGCFLMSNRLTHYGMANRSDRVRPVLSMNFQRAWFRDAANHAKQKPVAISHAEFERVPDHLKSLFGWAVGA